MDEQNNQSNTNMEELKSIVAQNLVNFRKQTDLTQQDLAQKLNYSDKAVSKWERGESIPDVFVLKSIADIYGVTVNDFLVKHNDPLNIKHMRRNLVVKRWLIALLSAGIVWLLATVVTVTWMFADSSARVAKYAYLVALPASLIVLLVFSCLWCKIWEKCGVASLLLWSLCVMVDVFISDFATNISFSWLIYIIGAVLQLFVILWYLLRFVVLKDKKRNEKQWK